MNSLLRDQRGSVLTLAALLFPVLLGFAALAIDLGNLYYAKSKVQMAADAASLGAVFALPDATAAASQALDLVSKNTPPSFGVLSKAQDVTVGIWDASAKTFTASSTNPNAVQVSTHRTVANGNPVMTYFGKFVGSSELEVNGKAIAVKYGGACIRVLDTTVANAFSDSGNGSTTLNCSMQVDSSASTAALTQGSSSVTSTKDICLVGGYGGSGWSPVPRTGCKVLGDPLASVPEPAVPVASCSMSGGGTTLSSNCKISGNVSLGGTINLQSGLYYLQGANLSFSSTTTLTGSGVTIFVDSASTLSFGGGGIVTLSAATSGSYAGLLIFQSRSTPATTTLSVKGGGSLSLNGTLYAPSATLSLGANGASSATANFGYVVGDKITIGSSSNFVFNAFAASGITPRMLRVHAVLVS